MSAFSAHAMRFGSRLASASSSSGMRRASKSGVAISSGPGLGARLASMADPRAWASGGRGGAGAGVVTGAEGVASGGRDKGEGPLACAARRPTKSNPFQAFKDL